MLHSLLIDAESLKGQIPARSVMGLHRSRQEKRTLHIQILHTTLHHRQFQRDDPCHLNRATERDFAVALAEMEIADAEFGAGDVDREEDFAAAAQVFDVAVAAMLGAAGYSPRALFAHFFLELARRGASMDVLGLRWLRDDTFEFGGADEMGFAAVPLSEDLGGGSTAEDARVDETRKSEMRDMAGGAEDAFEVPDCFSANDQCDVSIQMRRDLY